MHRIFAHVPARPALPRPARPQAPVVIARVKTHDDTNDRHIIDILSAPATFGETIEATYRRKERELAELFSTLTRNDSIELHRRLSNPDDVLAQRFGGLVSERRTRLLALLLRSR